jgi:predicted Holliday junction resolvase-like endonuclease
MSIKTNEIKKLISFLQKNNFVAECNHCNESLKLKDVDLFALNEFTPEAEELYNQAKAEIAERRKQLKELEKKGPERSENTSKHVNLGFIFERIAPTLPDFPFDKNDCRSMFDPIDYVIFSGLHKTGKVDKLFFVDIKSGEARLSKTQKQIKEIVENKKVSFKLY